MKLLCSNVINHKNELKSYNNVNVIGIMGNYQWRENKLGAVQVVDEIGGWKRLSRYLL